MRCPLGLRSAAFSAKKILQASFLHTETLASSSPPDSGEDFWQGQKDLNPRHAVLETAALPTELCPYRKIKKTWWAIRDSNPGPTGYEPVALTN